MSQEKRVTHFTALQALVIANPICMIIDHLTRPGMLNTASAVVKRW